MRLFSDSYVRAALISLALAATSATYAETDEATDDAAVDAAPITTPRPPIATRQFNRWVCYAYGHRLVVQRFEGDSQWFAAGSGQGQAARTLAYNNALTACRSRYQVCTSEISSDCSVERRYEPIFAGGVDSLDAEPSAGE